MPSPTTLAAFAGASLLLILLPGPAMLFLVARGVAAGPRAGAVSALGIEAATAVYVGATALGLTAVLAASTVAFSVIRYAGAAYLVVLGVRTLRDRSDLVAPTLVPAPLGTWTTWRQGFLVGIGNPKVALFFLAFFPQFIHPDAGPVATQVLVLGAIMVAIGTLFDVGYGLFGGLVRRGLEGARDGHSTTPSPGRRRVLRRGRVAVGLAYIGLGGLTAVTGQRPA